MAGLVAGALLALTPAAALMFRFDNPDALLVFLMTLAAYVTLRATEQAHERIEPFLRRGGAALEAALDDYDDEALEAVRAFLTRLAAVLPGASDASPPPPADESPTTAS